MLRTFISTFSSNATPGRRAFGKQVQVQGQFRGFANSTSSTMTSAAESHSQSFKLSLCQIDVGDDKQVNIQTAKQAIDRAIATEQPQMVSLPEIWNSPYATTN